MDNRDLFTMRELGDRDLEQFNSLLKYAFQVTSDEMLKTGWQEDEMKYSKAPMLKNAFVLGWFHGENLASQIVIYPMEINIEGERFRMGGITGVATYPEYAGRGLIHSLMSECLRHMREQRQYISILCPYSIPFYRKMGWEVISDKLSFHIKDTQLPRRKPVPGMVERVPLDSEDLKNVYEYFALQHHGALIRDDLAWDEYWRWETEDMTAAIYYSEKHRPLGYVTYSIENEHFNIKELLYLNQEARHGLWNYISAHFSMITDVRGYNYTGEPLAFLLEDSEIRETIEPNVMGRIIDVQEFLSRYPFENYREALRLHLRIHDRMAEWNNGDFLLWVKNGEVICESCADCEEEDAAMVEMDIQTLTTMLMGYKRPSYLYENERLKMDYHLLPYLERLIPIEKPYFSDYF